MVCEQIVTVTEEERKNKRVVNVPFEWFECEKKRIAKTAEDGTELGIAIDTVLKDKDILAVTEDAIYQVNVLPAHLVCATVSKMEEMGRLCFELGNRHLSLEIEKDRVLVPYDEPTYTYLKHLGFQVTEITAPFCNYIVCKAHGHHH